MKRHTTKYQNIFYRERAKGRIYYARFNGREVALNKNGNKMTAKEADEILTAMKATKEAVIRIKSDDARTVHDLWLAYADLPAKSGNLLNCHRPSWSEDVGRYNNHIKPVMADTFVDEITDLKKLHVSVLKKKLSPQTCKHVIGLALRILRSGGIKIDGPTIKVDNQSVDTLPDETYQAFKEFLHSQKTVFSRMMLFAMFTGLRRNNLIMARWKDLDETGFLHLQAQDNKSKRREKILLNPQAKEILRKQGNGGTYLFPHENGGPLNRTTVTRNFGRLVKNSGLDFPSDWRPVHSLRHVVATRLINTGKVSLSDVQAQLCHKSPQMTARYSHLVDEARARISAISEEAL